MSYRRLSDASSKGTVADTDVDCKGQAFSNKHKLSYALPQFTNTSVEVLTQAYLAHYYSSNYGVGTSYLALATVVCGLARTVVQIGIGYLSDRTVSRFGRRTPWIYACSPIFAISTLFLLFPIDGIYGSAAAAWYTGAYFTFSVSYGVLTVTYNAVGAELCETNEARRALFSWQASANLLGLILVSGLTAAMAETTGMHVLGIMVCACILVAYWSLAQLSRNAVPHHEDVKMPLIPGLRATLQHKQYVLLLLQSMAGSLLNEITSMFLYFFDVEGLDDDAANAALSALMGAYIVGFFLAIPTARYLMHARGKVSAVRIGYCLFIAYGAVSYLMTVLFSSVYLMAPALVVLGVGTGIINLCQPIMINDVISLDQLRTQQAPRASTFHSIADLPTMLCSVLGRALPLMVLSGLGYESGQGSDQPAEVKTFLRLFITLLGCVSGALALLAMRNYKVTEAVHMQTLNAIERLSKGLSAQDPLTGDAIEPLSEPAERMNSAEGGTLKSLTDSRRQAEQFVYYFSTRELRDMLGQGKTEVLAIAYANMLLWWGYTGLLSVRGVQLLVARETNKTMLFAALACVALLVALYESLRRRGFEWFRGLTVDDFSFAVEDHTRRAPKWVQDSLESPTASLGPVARALLQHLVCGGSVCALMLFVTP